MKNCLKRVSSVFLVVASFGNVNFSTHAMNENPSFSSESSNSESQEEISKFLISEDNTNENINFQEDSFYGIYNQDPKTIGCYLQRPTTPYPYFCCFPKEK